MEELIRAFIQQYQGLIALGICLFLGIAINYKSKTVITKAPDKVMKITIRKEDFE